MENSERFALLSDEDYRRLMEASQNKNTVKSTNTWINAFSAWAKFKKFDSNLLTYTPDGLNNILVQFFCELRKTDGSEYEPDSLRVMQASIHRYLTENDYGKSIFKDPEFKGCRDALEGKARLLREEGKGKRPNASVSLLPEDENMLWEKEKLGQGSPRTLLHTLWYLFTQHFGLRGRQEHLSMHMYNFKKRTENGNTFIEYLEDPTKTRNGGLRGKARVANPKMFATGQNYCPVAYFDLYVSKRPVDMKTTGRFYLTPKKDADLDKDEVCYTRNPMGKNKICTIMKQIIAGTELERCGKRLTNHSGRKTIVRKLKKAKIPESSIIKVTGHTTPAGLRNYMILRMRRNLRKCQMQSVCRKLLLVVAKIVLFRR